MNLGHLVGDGTEGRNRTERNSLVVHIQSRHDHSHATVGEFVANLHKTIVQELGFIDTHHVDIRSQ